MVDEVSQINSQLALDMLRTFPGVKMLVLVGDLDQNYPVDWGKPFHDIVPLLKLTECAFFLETYHRSVGVLEKAVRCMRHCELDYIFANTMHYTREKSGEFVFTGSGPPVTTEEEPPVLFAIDAGKSVATANYSDPRRGERLIQHVEAAALFIVEELITGKIRDENSPDFGKDETVQFCTYNNAECDAINRVCKVYYHKQCRSHSDWDPNSVKWPLMNVHLGDRVMLLQNMRECFSAASEGFLIKADKGTYDRIKDGQRHVRSAMNGHSGKVVDVYTHFRNEKANQEYMTNPRRFKSTNGYGLRHGENLVLVIELESADNTFLHVSMGDYKRKDITFAWAISAYRAQGSEFRNVVYVCSNTHLDDPNKEALVTRYPTKKTYESRRTSYVALSRARKRCVMLFTNNYRDKLETLLREKEVIYASIFACLMDDEVRRVKMEQDQEEQQLLAAADREEARLHARPPAANRKYEDEDMAF